MTSIDRSFMMCIHVTFILYNDMFHLIENQIYNLMSVASLAGPISERVVNPVALQKIKQHY